VREKWRERKAFGSGKYIIYIIKSDRRPFPAAKKANILAD